MTLSKTLIAFIQIIKYSNGDQIQAESIIYLQKIISKAPISFYYQFTAYGYYIPTADPTNFPLIVWSFCFLFQNDVLVRTFPLKLKMESRPSKCSHFY